MEWEDFYDRFFEWADSTKASRISKLNHFGQSEEVLEVALELPDERTCSRFIGKALDHGVLFTADEVEELIDLVDKACLTRLVATARTSFKPYQVETLEDYLDEVPEHKQLTIERKTPKSSQEMKRQIKHHTKINNSDEDISRDFETLAPKQKTPGFLLTLLGLLIKNPRANKQDKALRRKGSIQCGLGNPNCKPHYGYRYGRWYYGHHHTEGCEFGGNCGSRLGK